MRGIKIASTLVFTTFVACNSGLPATDPTALTREGYEENSEEMEEPPADAAESPGEQDADEGSTECSSDDDCDDGYYCGKDPERSQRKDYCLPEG